MKKWHIIRVNDHLLSQYESSCIEWIIDCFNRLLSRIVQTPCDSNLPFQSTWIRWHNDNKYNLSFAWDDAYVSLSHTHITWTTHCRLHVHDFCFVCRYNVFTCALRIFHFHNFYFRGHIRQSWTISYARVCVNKLTMQWSMLRVGYFLKIRIFAFFVFLMVFVLFSISRLAGINGTKQEHRSDPCQNSLKLVLK